MCNTCNLALAIMVLAFSSFAMAAESTKPAAKGEAGKTEVAKVEATTDTIVTKNRTLADEVLSIDIKNEAVFVKGAGRLLLRDVKEITLLTPKYTLVVKDEKNVDFVDVKGYKSGKLLLLDGKEMPLKGVDSVEFIVASNSKKELDFMGKDENPKLSFNGMRYVDAFLKYYGKSGLDAKYEKATSCNTDEITECFKSAGLNMINPSFMKANSKLDFARFETRILRAIKMGNPVMFFMKNGNSVDYYYVYGYDLNLGAFYTNFKGKYIQIDDLKVNLSTSKGTSYFLEINAPVDPKRILIDTTKPAAGDKGTTGDSGKTTK